MAYPAGINALTVKTDYVDKYMAAHVNAIRTSLLEAAAELGDTVKGSAADLKTRLAIRIANDGKINQPQQLVTVGKTNADYTTISTALTAITDATDNKRYTVLVYPGVYAEQITMKAFVDVVGVSPYTCIINTSAYGLVTLSSGISRIANFFIQGPLGDEDFPFYVSGGTLYVYNCRIYCGGCSAPGLYTEGGKIIARDCVFSFSDDSAAYCQASGGDIDMYNCTYEGSYYPCQSIYSRGNVINIFNCRLKGQKSLYSDSTGSVNIFDSVLKSSGSVGLYITGTLTIKVERCSIIAAGNSQPVYYISANPTVHIYNSILYASGSAAECIYSANAVTGYFAGNVMNKGLHGNVTNGIGTPYNVIDSDVI